jgi:hypothetical protein
VELGPYMAPLGSGRVERLLDAVAAVPRLREHGGVATDAHRPPRGSARAGAPGRVRAASERARRRARRAKPRADSRARRSASGR